MKYRLMTVATTVFTGVLIYLFAFVGVVGRIHVMFGFGSRMNFARAPAPPPSMFWQYTFTAYWLLRPQPQ